MSDDDLFDLNWSFISCLRAAGVLDNASFTIAAAFDALVNFELSNELVGVNGFMLACR